MRGAQRQPPHVLHTRRLQRGERVRDVARVLILEVVVADRDDDVRPELRAHRLDQLHRARRPHALVRATVTLDPPARCDLEVEVDPLLEDRGRRRVARDRVGDRIADQRHVLQPAPAARADGRAESATTTSAATTPLIAADRTSTRQRSRSGCARQPAHASTTQGDAWVRSSGASPDGAGRRRDRTPSGVRRAAPRPVAS